MSRFDEPQFEPLLERLRRHLRKERYGKCARTGYVYAARSFLRSATQASSGARRMGDHGHGDALRASRARAPRTVRGEERARARSRDWVGQANNGRREHAVREGWLQGPRGSRTSSRSRSCITRPARCRYLPHSGVSGSVTETSCTRLAPLGRVLNLRQSRVNPDLAMLFDNRLWEPVVAQPKQCAIRLGFERELDG